MQMAINTKAQSSVTKEMAKTSGMVTASFSVQIKKNVATTSTRARGRTIFGMARALVSITQGSYTSETGEQASDTAMVSSS